MLARLVGCVIANEMSSTPHMTRCSYNSLDKQIPHEDWFYKLNHFLASQQSTAINYPRGRQQF